MFVLSFLLIEDLFLFSDYFAQLGISRIEDLLIYLRYEIFVSSYYCLQHTEELGIRF